MNDKNKSVLDVIGWCRELEDRLARLEKKPAYHIETESFEFSNDPVLAKKGSDNKEIREEITFETPFNNVPIVLPTIAAFNIDNEHDARLQVYVENATETGATIVVRTWREARVHYVNVRWLAIEATKG